MWNILMVLFGIAAIVFIVILSFMLGNLAIKGGGGEGSDKMSIGQIILYTVIGFAILMIIMTFARGMGWTE